MSFEIETPEDFESGFDDSSRLKKEGLYLLRVTHVNESPTNKKETKSLDGFRVSLCAEDGLGEGIRQDGKFTEQGKEIDIFFGRPDASHKDGGEFCRRKNSRFAVATSIMPEAAARKPGEKVTVNLQDAEGRFIVAKLALDKPDDRGRRFLDLSFSDIWHIDDPAVKDVPKNPAILKLLPAHLRRTAESFAKPDAAKKGAANGGAGSHANGGAAKQQPKQQPVTTPADDDDSDVV